MLERAAARRFLIATVAVACAVYAPSLGNLFALDDPLVAKAIRPDGTVNLYVRSLLPLHAYFQTNYWQGVDGTDVLYRPLTILSYAIVNTVVGAGVGRDTREAFAQHFVNVALHAVAVWLSYVLVRRLRCSRGIAVLTAALFAVHAIHSEVVAGVVGRAELLAFDCGIVSVLLVLRCSRHVGWAAVRRSVAAAVFVFAAVSSKESGVGWGCLALLAAAVRGMQSRPTTTTGLVCSVGAVAVAVALFLFLRENALVRVGADGSAWGGALEKSTVGLRVANALVQWAYALVVCVFPFHLSADHGPAVFAPAFSIVEPRVVASICLLCGVLWVGLRAPRRRPQVFLGTAAFFGLSFLTSNVAFRVGTDYAERLYYSPSIGIALLMSLAVGSRSSTIFGRRACSALLAAWFAWNLLLIVRRNGVWHDDATLAAAEVINQPKSARMRFQHAYWLERGGDREGLVRELSHVVELFPDHAEAWSRIGSDHVHSKRWAQAKECFERSLRARAFQPKLRVEVALNLVATLIELKETGEIPAALDAALLAEPRALAGRIGDVRRAAARHVPYEWFDDYLARLAAKAPDARPWAYERAWHAQGRMRTREAVEFSRQALASPLPQLMRAEMAVILAASLVATGRTEEGRDWAKRVVDDVNVPAELRQRAAEILETGK